VVAMAGLEEKEQERVITYNEGMGMGMG